MLGMRLTTDSLHNGRNKTILKKKNYVNNFQKASWKRQVPWNKTDT